MFSRTVAGKNTNKLLTYILTIIGWLEK